MFQQQALVDEMDKLGRFALRLTKNPHNAEDLLQSTLLRALENKDSFENGTNLFSWTSKIMFNFFVSGYRQKKKFETQYDPEPYIAQMSVAPSQEAVVDLRSVGEHLDRLGAEHREIIRFVCVRDMSYNETARALRIPVGTVRSRLSRARLSLHQMMTPAASQRGIAA